ncbi:hypothetical protein L2E82_11490 [Cichorium intybus]|uniref:Uncharacterized protein n=1 Tax=Cichorium intybus TaxID=13427 RepID=A0ACB9GEK7_CICIN|nr:hypothetical protein L2E82_11490 [Cichorium intybus]
MATIVPIPIQQIGTHVDLDSVNDDATKLKSAIEYKQIHTFDFAMIFRTRSFFELKAIFESYHQKYGNLISEDIKDSGNDMLESLLKIMFRCIVSPKKHFAESCNFGCGCGCGIENGTTNEDPLINDFVTEDIRKYITPKETRVGKKNIYGIDEIYNTIGHGCVSMKKELEEYMDYDIGLFCKDDWNIAQNLMIKVCDPLPKRRCLTRASKLFQKPYPINETLSLSLPYTAATLSLPPPRSP